MRYGNFDIIVPQLSGEPCSEVEAVGAATWLWMHSAVHGPLPVASLATLLLPPIKRGQFLLVYEAGRPVGYLAWAMFSEDAERRYLHQPSHTLPAEAWSSGDRIWIMDAVAPFGHTHSMRSFITHRLFFDRCFRTLYHRGAEKGLRIIEKHGAALLREEARRWFDMNPACLD